MEITSDQYVGLSKLEKWYRKYSKQIIEISGVIGTGTWDLIHEFIEISPMEQEQVMYLSYDQKQVVELAAKRYHAYYINSIIYTYDRIVNWDSLYVINPHTTGFECEWKKRVRSKIDPRYKLIVVFDSLLLNEKTVNDLRSFGLPIILVRDPMLLPASDTYTFVKNPDIMLREINPVYLQNPLVYFTNKMILSGINSIKYGEYDNLTVVPKRQMNIYNMKSADMIITMTDEMRNNVNKIYRSEIMKLKTLNTSINERVIVMDTMYGHKLVNSDVKKLKLYLTKGMVGYIDKINKHALSTRYVNMNFRPEFYFEAFEDLSLDRAYLNNIEMKSRQEIPDETIHLEYAYALTPQLARFSHWNRVTMIVDYKWEDLDEEVLTRLLYTGMTRATESLTIIM